MTKWLPQTKHSFSQPSERDVVAVYARTTSYRSFLSRCVSRGGQLTDWSFVDGFCHALGADFTQRLRPAHVT